MHNPSQFHQGQRALKEERGKREREKKTHTFNKRPRVGGEEGNVPLNLKAFCLLPINHTSWCGKRLGLMIYFHKILREF